MIDIIFCIDYSDVNPFFFYFFRVQQVCCNEDVTENE
jgi:hypothetical protein